MTQVQGSVKPEDLEVYHNINFEGIDEDLAAFQEDEMVQQALMRGVDLKKYAAELQADLRKVEGDSVQLYVAHNAEVETLHHQMQDCDRVLGRMEEMLRGFQADLGEISSEIKHLQENSMSMSVKLRNRRHVEDCLHAFLSQAHIPPSVAVHINSPLVNEGFLEAVQTLQKRLKYLEMSSPPSDGSCLDLSPQDTSYARSLLPELEKLKIKAIGKIRDHFIAQFNALRKPKCNVVMAQQVLLRYAGLFHFVRMEGAGGVGGVGGGVAEELRGIYTEGMSKTVSSLFKNYYAALGKHEISLWGKGESLGGAEGEGWGGGRGLFSARLDMSKSVTDPYTIGERLKILEEMEREPILVHMLATGAAAGAAGAHANEGAASAVQGGIVVSNAIKLPYEVIFRSVLKHLVDASSSEFIFLLDFFQTGVKDTFNRIYSRTLSLLLEQIENFVLTCHDPYTLLLCVRISHSLRGVMQRRRVPVLDPLFDRLPLLFWPKIQQILDAQIKSIKSLAHAPAGIRGGLGGLGVGGPKGGEGLVPLPSVRRYAELCSSLLLLLGAGVGVGAGAGEAAGSGGAATGGAADVLGVGGGGELLIKNNLDQLRKEIIALLERASASFPSPKEQRVFFINNFDLTLTLLTERGVGGSDEGTRWADLLLKERELYAEEQVKSAFPRLRQFVLQTEQLIAEKLGVLGAGAVTGTVGGAGGRRGSVNSGGGIEGLTLDDGVVESLVKEFAGMWRQNIQQVNDEVLLHFANLRGGMEILKQVLTQLLLYYTRFQDIIKKCYPKPPAFVRDIVSTATIMMEIKRYSRNF